MKGSCMKMERQSPVHLPGQPEKTETRNHWPVVLEYANENPGPWIVDLSHCPRWDIQGAQLDSVVPEGLLLPAAPGAVTWTGGVLLGRTGLKQTFMWIFDDSVPPAIAGCTETTEGSLCLALLGQDIFQITEKLTHLDLCDPKRKAPFLVLGPFCHVTCQIVVLKNDPAKAAVLVACPRGFADDMIHAVLKAGEEFGLRPAGEKRSTEYIPSAPGSKPSVKPKTSARKPTTAEKPKSSGRARSKKTS
jgi:hypothetical protein